MGDDMRKALLLAAAAVASLTTVPAFAANLIQDGDFNGGTGRGFSSSWYIQTSATSTADSLLRVRGQDYTNCCGAPGSEASRNNFFATFGAGDSPNSVQLAQDFSAGAGTYDLSFAAGAFGGAQRITYGIFDYTAFSYIFAAFVEPTPTTDLDKLFTTFSNSVNLTGGDYALVFNTIGSDTASTDGMVDKVSLTAAVPEAGTWAMMIIGFGAVGGAMRRRKPSVRVTYA